MWTRHKGSTGRHIVLLIGQLILLFLSFTYIDYEYLHSIYPDKRANAVFQPTSCMLISEKLTTRASLFREYRAEFLVSYNVNGTQYSRWVSGNGLTAEFTRNQTRQEVILNHYAPGSSYTCYYDPENPAITVLTFRHNWLSTLSLLIPALIFLLTLYFSILNISALIKDDKEYCTNAIVD